MPSAALPSAAIIAALLQAGGGLVSWPNAIRAGYRGEVVRRIERDQHFLFLFGLLVCLATILIDLLINPAIAKDGAVLRVLAVAPITLLGLIAGARGWHGLTAFCLGASPTVFAVVIVHLAAQLPPEGAARYLAAAAMLLGFANIVLPFTIRGLVGFDLAYIAAAGASDAGSARDWIPPNPDFLVLLVIVAVFTVALARRYERLRQHNFLLDLHGRATSRELLEANRRLRALSDRDPLTGLANRRSFNRQFDDLVRAGLCHPGNPSNPGDPAGGAARQCRIAVLMIDLDHFKAFNDNHGHLAGDEALRLVGREVAAILAQAEGIAARFGGEEFIAALCEREPGAAGQVAEDIRCAVAALTISVGRAGRTRITTSVGLALAPPDQTAEREQLVRAADEALYNAKRAGRNRVKAIELDPEPGEGA